MTNADKLANLKRCNNNNGICVKQDLCLDGQINTVGHLLIEPKLGNTDFDECDEFGVMCCALPKQEDDSDESFSPEPTTTTEPPEDLDWSRQCGQRTNVSEKVDKVHETNRWEFPWAVAVFSVTKIFGKARKEFLCGGTLIDDYLVVTAARCVHQKYHSNLIVQLGRWNLDAPMEPRMQEVPVEELLIHRGYVPSSQLNNIALLVLANGAILGKAVNRVCLPDANVLINGDSVCYVVGWSNTRTPNTKNQQLKLRATFATTDDCMQSIRRATRTSAFLLPKENICPDYLDLPEPCERAAGSGLVCESQHSSGQFFLVGIASHAFRNCHQFQAHDVFLKTVEYLPWIDDHVRNQSRQTSFYRPESSNFEES
ncbi:inactive CLIP domain-containing serine protease A30-like [Anopheles nili]|uniref:inactive CLIP domain-containing serine protease A30-like n=1 Tax=Anopheles nili TaxID=185578 RepID=UPI00237AA841|nr:inactive CLIP domain-containing serine protease A30-like [Anopheles nili]